MPSLPPGWILLQDPTTSRHYFCNPSSNSTTWSHPTSSDVWRGYVDDGGRRYFVNEARGVNVWELPRGVERFLDATNEDEVVEVDRGEGQGGEGEGGWGEGYGDEGNDDGKADVLDACMSLDLGAADAPHVSLMSEAGPGPDLRPPHRSDLNSEDVNTVEGPGKPLAFELRQEQVEPPPFVQGGGGGIVGSAVGFVFRVVTAGGAGAAAVVGMAVAAADEGRVEAIKEAIEVYRLAS